MSDSNPITTPGLDCVDCKSEGNAVAVHFGNDRGDPLCVPCRIARSEERVRVSREIAGLPVPEPEPVPVSWAAVRAAALDCSLADWTDPFDDD